MRFFQWLSQMKELPWYILTRAVLLSCALLLSALVVLLSAHGLSAPARFLREYAGYTCVMGVAVFFAGLFASAFLEDLLRS